MRLLPSSEFAHVFVPLAGKKIGIVDGWGNVGDDLIYAATRQVMRDFGLSWVTFNPLADNADDFNLDVLLLFGGGSMGAKLARPAMVIRQAALDTGIPCVVLPQSFHAPEDLPYKRVYVREHASMAHCQGEVLAPDLALGFDFPEGLTPEKGTGVFLRVNGEPLFRRDSRCDPANFCHTPGEYIQFASRFEHIVTDRLHFAIVGLGLGRRVTLLPVGYHKNRSMWETWLKDLGCEWADSPY
jgi:exopolysaccharide biosynthesis predicted pyruvyltransferase EpsI